MSDTTDRVTDREQSLRALLDKCESLQRELREWHELSASWLQERHALIERAETAERRLREAEVALVKCAVPYEALLLDQESRKWIAPQVWKAIESAVLAIRNAVRAAPVGREGRGT